MQPDISDQIFYSFLTGGLCASSSNTNTTTSSFYPFGIEEDKISQDNKSLAAMRNHKEAERRRREKINSHLNKLRNLLSCNYKTDKATLLAKVVQRVKELKQQISDNETLPSESDEINVLNFKDCPNEENGRIILKISLSCEDKPNLLQELIKILKSLHMKTTFVDITTISGRIRNDLVVVGDNEQHGLETVRLLQNALESLLERLSDDELVVMGRGGERLKRRRSNLDHIIMV
ncbi:unnamed protein product [Cochlearia groenlandica]